MTIYPDGSNELKSGSQQLTAVGIDQKLLAVYRQIATGDIEWDDETAYTITGYTHATISVSDGESINYNSHPCYHGAAWYDWAYIHYEVDGEQRYYPSRILGFARSGKGDINAIIQYSIEDVPWDRLEEEFVVPFRLCAERGKEDIVPLSSLCHPICVVPDIGGEDANGYMMILPKGQWSQYFTRFYNKTI